ncbi:MAG: hypothetical protein LWW92_11475 [Rhodocyclales bacterium]|nr:hypothetical protein [Rhodocyclales bacterium]
MAKRKTGQPPRQGVVKVRVRALGAFNGHRIGDEFDCPVADAWHWEARGLVSVGREIQAPDQDKALTGAPVTK